MDDLEIIEAKYNEDDNSVYVNAIKNSALSSITINIILEDN